MAAAAPAPGAWRAWLLAFGLALAVLAGPAFPTYRHYDFSHSRDTLTYLSLARGDYAGLSVTRRYRVVVPWLARALVAPAHLVAARGRLHAPAAALPADAALRLAFLVVNTTLLAAAGALIFRTAQAAGATPLAAAAGMMVALSSRWATYSAALPLTDSLYLLTFALGLYGVVRGAGWAVLAAALVGPVAKESFVFVVPWLVWFGRKSVPLPALLAALAGGYGAVAAAHAYVDARAGAEASASVGNAFAHLSNVTYSLRRLFSAHGLSEMFSIFGPGWLLLLAGGAAGLRWSWQQLGPAGRWLGLTLVPHLLLSGDLGRMGYLAFAVFGVVLALIFQRLAQTGGILAERVGGARAGIRVSTSADPGIDSGP